MSEVLEDVDLTSAADGEVLECSTGVDATNAEVRMDVPQPPPPSSSVPIASPIMDKMTDSRVLTPSSKPSRGGNTQQDTNPIVLGEDLDVDNDELFMRVDMLSRNLKDKHTGRPLMLTSTPYRSYQKPC
jgi:hypothetical protein